jgi:hypothetical protein
MAVNMGPVPHDFFVDDKGAQHPEFADCIPLVPADGGALGWGKVYLSFACDFGDVLVRCAIWNDTDKAWRGYDTPVLVQKNAGRVSIPLKDGDSKFSVARLKNPKDPQDTGVYPCRWMTEAALKAA